MEFIVQKCTEVGVHAIVPVVSERTIVHLGERESARVERWRRIAREAAEQCGRRLVPEVAGVRRLREIDPPPGAPLLVLWEGAGADSRLTRVPRGDQGALPGSVAQVGIVVGPEGGLSEGEVSALVALGGVCVSLGPRILRAETAGLVAAALVLSRHGDLG